MKIHYFKPKRQKNSLFIKVLIAVGIVQTALLLLLGGIMVTQTIFPKEQVFDAPPPPPPNQEIKQKKQKLIVKKTQQRSNQNVRRINVPKVQNISTPTVSINLPSGLGGEGDGGFAPITMTNMSLDKMKIEMPTFELFGLKGSSDRVLIVFDACEKTMTDEMGGLDAYNVVKNEISALIRGLPSTALFNVMAFDPGRWPKNVQVYRESLVPATESNKQGFESWIRPINESVDHIGLPDANYELRYPPIPFNTGFKYPNDVWQHHGVVFWYMAYQAAIEQGAGVIFFLTTHWPRPDEYYVKMTDSQHEKFMAETKKNADAFVKSGGTLVSEEEKNRFYSLAREAAKRKVIDPENERRKAKGIPLWVVRDPWGVAYQERNGKVPEALEAMKRKTWDDFRPEFKFARYTQGKIMAYYEPIFKKNYDDKNLKRPVLNMIVMQPKNGDPEWNKKYGSTTRSWAKANGGGSVRILRGAKPVAEY